MINLTKEIDIASMSYEQAKQQFYMLRTPIHNKYFVIYESYKTDDLMVIFKSVRTGRDICISKNSQFFIEPLICGENAWNSIRAGNSDSDYR